MLCSRTPTTVTDYHRWNFLSCPHVLFFSISSTFFTSIPLRQLTFETKRKIKVRHDYQRIDLFALSSGNLLGCGCYSTNRPRGICAIACVSWMAVKCVRTLWRALLFTLSHLQLAGIFKPVCIHGSLRGSRASIVSRVVI